MSATALAGCLSLTLDGRRLQAAAGRTLLEVARAAGIVIPTLCDHPDLEPAGACRLCLVEVTHPDWRGWSGLVTACLYPVSEGLVVRTRSDSVMEARRGVLSLLAARCPGSSVIAELARDHGAEAGRLVIGDENDHCILCGLCVRVCETYATSAIATIHRGKKREVGTPFGQPPMDCVGCGACAVVCPTGHIRTHLDEQGFHIWGRVFPTHTATVDEARCLGCGACEATCPFSVPSVRPRADGTCTGRIPVALCRGCGACTAVCPSGAITQVGPAGLEALLGELREARGAGGVR